MAGLRIRLLAWAGVAALSVSGAISAGASALSVGVTVPGVGSVEARLPDVQVSSVTVPSVTVPSLPPPPAPVPSSPSVQTPSVQTPSVQTPSVSTPSTSPAPSVEVEQQQAGSAATGTAPGSSRVDAGGGTAAVGAGSGGSSGDPANDATQGSSGSAEARRVRQDGIRVGGYADGPADSLVAQRRLELAVERGRQCLDELGSGERRVLGLRAGLGPGAPLARSQVARRLDLGLAQTGRIERRGLRRLDTLVDDGACGGVGSAAAAVGQLGASRALAGAGGYMSPGADASHPTPRFGVGGVVAHGGEDQGSGGRAGFDALPPPIGDGGEATLLVALGLLVALALLVRRELQRR